MSQADIERFIGDIKGNSEILGELQKGSTGLAHVVDYATSKGYDVTMDEAKAYISSQANQDLSDDQLDAVAGGKGSHTGGTNVQTMQTVAIATTEAVTTETTATVAAETVAVIVLT